MKILHYALGFPPYRSGGLTRYAMDLMGAQRDEGHKVTLLWPGCMRSKIPYVKRHRDYNGIASFELCNPLPVVLDQPVGEPDAFHYSVDGSIYMDFLVRIHPNVIHIHTLQGLHKEFVNAARDLRIPTVFTTHDFFGLYPMNREYPMDRSLNDAECTVIDEGAPSLRSIRIQQSTPMRWVKSSVLARRLLASLVLRSKRAKGEDVRNGVFTSDIRAKDYTAFREYETSILNGIDLLLFNSDVSQTAYVRYCTPRASTVIPVTHDGLPHQIARRVNSDDEQIHVAYLGGTRPYKGFDVLMDAVGLLSARDMRRFHFDVFGVDGKDTANISFLPAYTDFNKAMTDIDVVVVPSTSYESFGFVVLESLCAGIPVIVSDCVGASMIVDERYGRIFPAGNAYELAQTISFLTKDGLEMMGETIRTTFTPPSFQDHARTITNAYVELTQRLGQR